MKVEHKAHTTILKDTDANCEFFAQKIAKQYHEFKNQNLILDVSHDSTFSISKLVYFQETVKKHKKEKKSIIFIAQDINFNAVPEKYTVVPSLQEAHDIIEMEIIERDLGF